ncbi:MAG: glycosyltransferase [Acidobacteria bacterium]|nr:glycosyltransferase [Acidobacteriota bacterium]
MRTWPFVSVVVPVLNEAEHVDACLKALLAQTYPPASREIIVVDNGSTDDTPARAARYPVTVSSALVRGPARARNTGIRQARGDFIVFLDGDCVPGPHWLTALLEAWDDPAVGFFVGEIEGAPSPRLVSRFTEYRRVISQADLLSQVIPTAATGNLAVSRAALERVGVFDESFRWGEDADLTWRVQTVGGLDFRYNPRAVVVHPGPDGLRQLAARSFHEGLGVAAFRRKHARDFHPRFLSAARYRWACWRTAAGLLRYPWMVRAHRTRGLPWPKALAYPFLDKLRTVSLLAGISRGLSGGEAGGNGPAPVRVPAGAAGEPAGPGHGLRMDIEQEPLLRDGPAGLTARVRGDLREISRALLRVLPRATVLLTGSLSVNEGRWETVDGEAVCRSDYDLVVIAPDWRLLRPARLWALLGPRLRALGLAATLDIGLVWAPVFRRGWSTTGGRIVAGDPAASVCLEALTAPRASGALWRSFKHLAEALLYPAAFSALLGKALLEAAQARLLHACRGRPRPEWVDLLRTDRVRDRIQPYAPELGPDALALIGRAADLAAGRPAVPLGAADTRPAQGVLRQVRKALPPPGGLRHRLVEVSRTLHRRRFRSSKRPPLSVLLDQMDALATAWLAGEPDPPDRLSAPETRSRPNGPAPAADDPRAARYRRVFLALQEQGDFFPHKFILPAAPQGPGTAGRP